MNMILCGLPMSGKTTIGQLLAERLNRTFIDTDHLIETAHVKRKGVNLSRRQIFLTCGEEYFRKLETEQITQLLEEKSVIIALGGGTLHYYENVEIVQKIGRIIYLNVPVVAIWKRMLEKGVPPLLNRGNPEEELHQLAEKRKPVYETVAHTIIHVGMKSAQEIVEEIIQKEINHGK